LQRQGGDELAKSLGLLTFFVSAIFTEMSWGWIGSDIENFKENFRRKNPSGSTGVFLSPLRPGSGQG